MHAVVFMEESPCHEFVHSLFKPGVDHVPVAMDFSDLAAKAEATLQDEAQARRMADRWVKQGIEATRLTCVLDYLDALLRRLAGLLTYKPQYHPDWPLFHTDFTPGGFVDDAALLNETTCIAPVYGTKPYKRAMPC